MNNSFRYRLLLLVFVTAIFSCAEISEEKNTNTTEKENSKTRYGSALKQLPEISEVARLETDTWSVFDDFKRNILALKNATVPSLVTTSEKLTRQTDSLLKKIPEALDTRPVYARLKLTDTRAKLLEQHVNYDRVDSLLLETSLKEMNNATTNLFVEINRTFKKNKIDEELKESEKKELEKQKRFLDSVYQAEIKDNNGD